MNRFGWIGLAGMAGLALCGMACVPDRVTSDGTRIPLIGLGDGLPKEGRVPPAGQGPIDYESLYVAKDLPEPEPPGLRIARLAGTVGCFRFWPSGHVLHCGVALDRAGHLDASDGRIVGDRLGGEVGRFVVVGEEIYIEIWHEMGWRSWLFSWHRGRLTETGFIVTEYWTRGEPELRRTWHSVSPREYVRRKVGPMGGPALSEFFEGKK